jgi:hypothetical protein
MSMDCKICGGLGTIEKDEKLYECDCEKWRRIALSMEPRIRSAECRDEHVVHPLVDMVKESCYVHGSWADLDAIIKVAIIKYWPRLVKTTSDREVRDVYVGDRSKKAHSEGFDGKIYNTLEDLMDPPDLMVVRLNELSYSNKAASGALEEALSYRFDRKKPTWVLSNIDRPFSYGSHAYSDALMELLHTTCKKVHVQRIIQKVTFHNSILSPEITPNAQEPITPPPQRKPQKPFGRDTEAIEKPRQIKYIPDSDNPLDSIGQGVPKAKKFRSRD